MTWPALLAAALAASARAGVLVYDGGPGEQKLFSGDGYHAARLVSDEKGDRWLVDERTRATGKPGDFLPDAVLSENGAVLLHAVRRRDEAGRPAGVSAAVNGRVVGAAYADLSDLTLSPSGSNAAYAGRTRAGWSVVSGQGVGPAFPKPPLFLAVSDQHVLYQAVWQGQRWLYRDHKPAGRAEFDAMAVSPDLSRVAGLRREGGRFYVDIDGIALGPYAAASAPVLSRSGRHWAFFASESAPGGYDLILADGRRTPLQRCSKCTPVVGDDGRVFVDTLLMAIDDRSQMHRFALDGKTLGGPPKLGLQRGGGHFVYPMLGSGGGGLGVDGRVVERDVPLPISDAPVEMDGAREYHYWALEGSSLRFVCGTIDGSDPARGRCAAYASQLRGQPLPPAPAGSAAQ